MVSAVQNPEMPREEYRTKILQLYTGQKNNLISRVIRANTAAACLLSWSFPKATPAVKSCNMAAWKCATRPLLGSCFRCSVVCGSVVCVLSSQYHIIVYDELVLLCSAYGYTLDLSQAQKGSKSVRRVSKFQRFGRKTPKEDSFFCVCVKSETLSHIAYKYGLYTKHRNIQNR